jgi:hypothetical protein
MEIYLFKSAACLAILYSFYKLFLEKETIHTFKRFYLLGSLLLSFTIPILTFTSYVVKDVSVYNSFVSQTTVTEVMASEVIETTNYLPYILWTIYGLGVLFFSLKFFRNLHNLLVKIKANPKLKQNRITNVLLKDLISPHTFFSYIFLNKQKFEAKEIPSEVLIHEETHALQKHSLDVLLVELLQIFFWFNPLIHLLRHSIKLNHEFLADRAVLHHGIETTAYQNLILAFSSNAASPQLANSLNYSSIKKRFTVMKNRTSKRGALLRTSLLLPLTAILIYGFSTHEIVQTYKSSTDSEIHSDCGANEAQIQAYNKMAAFWNNYFLETDPERIMPLSELKKLESLYRVMTPEQQAKAEPFPECNPPANTSPEKATPDQIAEYNKLAKKYNEMPRNNMFIEKKDVDRLKYLYNLMTPEQRKKAEPLPKFPPPPPAPDAPPAMDAEMPPPPPMVHQTPIDHLVRMAYENAAFFYENEKITSNEAIALLKKNKDLNIETTTFKASNPVVKITKDPIVISDSKTRVIKGVNDQEANIPPPPPKPTAPLPAPNPLDLIVDMAKKGATFYNGADKISSDKAIEMVKKDYNIMINVENPDSKNPIVRLGGC